MFRNKSWLPALVVRATLPATAVTIRAPDLAIAIHAEYWFLFHCYGRDWKLGRERRSTPAADGRVFDQLELIFPDQATEWSFLM